MGTIVAGVPTVGMNVVSRGPSFVGTVDGELSDGCAVIVGLFGSPASSILDGTEDGDAEGRMARILGFPVSSDTGMLRDEGVAVVIDESDGMSVSGYHVAKELEGCGEEGSE